MFKVTEGTNDLLECAMTSVDVPNKLANLWLYVLWDHQDTCYKLAVISMPVPPKTKIIIFYNKARKKWNNVKPEIYYDKIRSFHVMSY